MFNTRQMSVEHEIEIIAIIVENRLFSGLDLVYDTKRHWEG